MFETEKTYVYAEKTYVWNGENLCLWLCNSL